MHRLGAVRRKSGTMLKTSVAHPAFVLVRMKKRILGHTVNQGCGGFQRFFVTFLHLRKLSLSYGGSTGHSASPQPINFLLTFQSLSGDLYKTAATDLSMHVRSVLNPPNDRATFVPLSENLRLRLVGDENHNSPHWTTHGTSIS